MRRILKASHQGAACDAASVHFGVAVRRTVILVYDRFDDEVAGHQKRRDEVATLKATVKQKECEIAELSSYMECLKAELDLLKPRADKYAHDCESYRQQYVFHADVRSH